MSRANLGSRRGAEGRGSSGYATAELALALPALCLLVGVMVSLLGAVAAQVRCVDAARAAVRAAARGESADAVTALAVATAPRGASVQIGQSGGALATDVTVTVTAEIGAFGPLLPGVTVHASAVAAREDVGP